ncbi:MAG: heparinase II/III domain-containing protein, partial [Caldimonas sp.]
RVPAMLRWLAALTHPDGTLGRFNDCADGVAPANAELFRLAAELGFAADASYGDGDDDGVLVLADSGYVRVERNSVVALLDVAPVGPDYLPGHAHADTLSFELSLAGRRVVVNGGTSCYGDGAQRQRERATAAHSTVEIDGESSSEVWAGFRVGRRARPDRPRIERDGAALRIACGHDGYAHLPGRPVHRRAWSFDPDGMAVEDLVSNARSAALARFHLAPGLTLSPLGNGRWRVADGGATLAEVDVVAGRASQEPSFHAPRFGVVEPTTCLAVALDGGRALTRWAWRR